MRITLAIEGGFAALPGLTRPRTADVATWPAADRLDVARLIEAARFFDLPEHDKRPSVPDARLYRVTIETREASHTAEIKEPFANEAIGALIGFLRQKIR